MPDIALPSAPSPTFPASRAEALRRLTGFLPQAGAAYAAGRNADHGPGARTNVSNLSPYLRYRLVTEEEVSAAASDQHGHLAAGKFTQEVAWRTYWKGWLELRPAAWTRFVAERDAARDGGSGLAKAVAQAEAGTTGIEGFDDWARELKEHGYLHNHARMWFASIWIFTLRLPWVLGADFFLRHLVDADPASNTLSWRWVAGLQTKGKTYLATADNIARYTGGRFNPTGLARRADALTETPLPAARALPPVPAGEPGQPALLLAHAEDFCPERMFLGTGPVAAALVVNAAAHWPWGDAAATFVAAAAHDTANRIHQAFGCPASVADADAGTIIGAAQAAGVRAVVTPYAPVGPVADALDQLEPALAAEGVSLVRVRRDWDERLWPYATKGFFAFKERL